MVEVDAADQELLNTVVGYYAETLAPMIEVLYGTGIRRGELARLNVRGLDIERHTLMVRQGKGRKDRMVPIGPRVVAVDRALPYRDQAQVGGRTGRRDLVPHRRRHTVQRRPAHPTRQGLRESVRDGQRRACHLFRHTLATLMLESGADIRYIQAMLGHAELSTTQIYTQVSIRALQAVHAATFPAATNVPRSGRRDDSGHDDLPESSRSSVRLSCLLLSTPKYL